MRRLHNCLLLSFPRGCQCQLGGALLDMLDILCAACKKLTVCLSRLMSRCPCALAVAAGCGAILVGESIVKQGDPEAAVKALLELQ